MAVDPDAVTLLIALEVTDEAGYSSYRAGMRPILTEYGGRFGIDVRISEVLEGPVGPGANRLFTIEFPTATAREAFFADDRYRAVRARWFDAAVARIDKLGM